MYCIKPDETSHSSELCFAQALMLSLGGMVVPWEDDKDECAKYFEMGNPVRPSDESCIEIANRALCWQI